jgi:hypothetical protein
MKKKLFLEIDKAEDGWLDTLSYLAKHMFKLSDTEGSFFDTVIEEAAFHSKEVWKAVKEHDQIFASTSLIPRYGYGGSFGSGTLMNNLMYKAIEENVEGKELYIFNTYEHIWWSELDRDLVDKCFRKNFLYTHDEDHDNWIQVDVDKLLKDTL